MKNDKMMMVMLLGFLVGVSGAWAADQKPNCRITVVSTKKTGEVKTRHFEMHFDSKKECEEAAKVHDTNFLPKLLAKKEVKFEWKDGR